MHATFTLCVLSTGDNRFLDPTDASGEPSPYPGPGPPWPFPVKVLLCRANEPPKGGRGTNCFVETGMWCVMVEYFLMGIYQVAKFGDENDDERPVVGQRQRVCSL